MWRLTSCTLDTTEPKIIICTIEILYLSYTRTLLCCVCLGPCATARPVRAWFPLYKVAVSSRCFSGSVFVSMSLQEHWPGSLEEVIRIQPGLQLLQARLFEYLAQIYCQIPSSRQEKRSPFGRRGRGPSKGSHGTRFNYRVAAIQKKKKKKNQTLEGAYS